MTSAEAQKAWLVSSELYGTVTPALMDIHASGNKYAFEFAQEHFAKFVDLVHVVAVSADRAHGTGGGRKLTRVERKTEAEKAIKASQEAQNVANKIVHIKNTLDTVRNVR